MHVFLSELTVPMHALQVFVVVSKYFPASQAVQVVKSAFTVPMQLLHLAGVSEESDQVLFAPQGTHENLSSLTEPLQSLQAPVVVSKYM